MLNHVANGAKSRPFVNLRSTYSVELTVTLGQGFDSIPEKKKRQNEGRQDKGDFKVFSVF